MGEEEIFILNKYTDEDKLRQFDVLANEANTVRDNDKILIRNLFKNFYNKRLNVGIGFQRAYGSILAGDFFDLIKLPDGNYLFVFADISGHGLPAYTTLIRFRSAITLALREIKRIYLKEGIIDSGFLIREITRNFTDIMDDSNSDDFASVIFTFIYSDEDRFLLRFYNRSMLFPVVVRKFNNQVKDIYNLNNEEKGWFPNKGYLVGSDLRILLQDSYLETPYCDFIIYEGDSILFYSDGITEAYRDNPPEEFGEERIIQILKDNVDMPPQFIINHLFENVYDFIGNFRHQKDDMTAVLIDFPPVR
jgi:sigma-B regulation protein RsbU (phosphoserine phosphatase)